MSHFLVVAHDGTDTGAAARRLAARAAHFAFTKPMAERGEILAGGAILDDQGEMIGSALIVHLDKAQLDHWLTVDPYVTGDVWRDIKVTPMLIAPPQG